VWTDVYKRAVRAVLGEDGAMPSLLFRMPDSHPQPAWTEREWDAVHEHSRTAGAALMRVILGVAACVDVLLWFLDWNDGGVSRTATTTHGALLLLTLGFLRGPGEAWLARAPNAVGLLVLTPYTFALGCWLGAIPGPRSLAWLYLWGPTSVVFLLRIGRRIVVTLFLQATAIGGYLASAGAAGWGSPEFATQLSFMGFTLAMGIANGHFVYWASSGAAIQRIRLGERQTEVAALHAQLEDRVAAQQSELEALTAHLREVRDRERLTLGQEIRAELAPELDGLRRLVDTVGDAPDAPGAAALVTESRGQMLRTHDVFRRILNRLHPMVLKQLGLAAALRWLTDDAGQRAGVAVRLRVALGDRPRTAEEDRLIFLCVRDGLRRAELGGPPGAWEVVVQPDGADAMLVEVADDRVGPDETDSGMVLFVAVREQVLAEGGEVDIALHPGRGRVLRARIPVRGAA